MAHETSSLKMQDGICPLHIFTPAGGGPWPAVIFFMDGLGIRPALLEMGERLAAHGYYVAMPDLYYRTGFSLGTRLFSDPAVRAEWTKNVLPTVTVARVMPDVAAVLSFLERQPKVRHGKVGVTGYCLGGRVALAAAGHFQDHIAAVASYHAGGLATDAPDSPHRFVPRIRGRVYVAGAVEDPNFDDAQKQRLEDALTAAHVDHKVETYPARHGWVPSDTPVHDPRAAERHWDTLFDLFDHALGEGAGATAAAP